MRKQTKLVAVLSAAALLAIGASMTSFAAGWQKNDDGSWSYYDNSDDLVASEWKKDGSKWFYLDDDGIMATDTWVDDEYYVDENGAMLINGWKKLLTGDDIDDPDEDGENWYYFGSKGKKTVDDSKKIGGKTYFFDEDGKMRDGWYEDSNNVYYLGDEDDGARKSGWLWLETPDEDDSIAGHTDDDDNCDEEAWYYFGSDGKMYKGADKKKVNGKYYYFNDHGQMLYEWINGTNIKRGTHAQLDGNLGATAPNATIGNMLYTNVVEEGWRADGWYEIDGSEDVGTNNDTDWYYFKDGEAKKAIMHNAKDYNGLEDDGAPVYRARIKAEGKYFCFNEKGQMQTGLQYIGDSIYYFDENGYMKTGKVLAAEENDSYTYYLQTKSGGNGKGITGEKDGYLYWNGKRLEADDDYRVYRLGSDEYYLVNNKGKIQKTNKKYDVENANGEDVEFVFSKNKINLDKSTSPKAVEEIKAVSYPKIELIDSVLLLDVTPDATDAKKDVLAQNTLTTSSFEAKYDSSGRLEKPSK